MKAFVFLTVLAVASSVPYGGSDRERETVPFKTLNKTIDGSLAFEIREYPAVKWVCTDMTYQMDLTEPEQFEDNSELGILKSIRKMMSGEGWKKRPSSGMFKRLFRYISGVNSLRQEVQMTTPVLSKMEPNQLTGEMTKRMCFYLDSAAQATTPQPEEDTVYLMESEPLKVAVYEFGGYAMQDSTWMNRVADFADRLGDRMNSVETEYFYKAGYDSPMKFWNRRNEVMFELKQ